MSVRVWAYTVVRNEQTLMPYWTRHYSTFCEKLIVFDDRSTDDTVKLAEAAGAEVRPYPFDSGLDDIDMVTVANETYREARGSADWIIWVDADEFIYHPRISDRLAEYTASGVGIPCIEGYVMFAPTIPSGTCQIYDEFPNGTPQYRYNKRVVICPDIEIIWDVGKHEFQANVAAETSDKSPLKLLHYRWLGLDEFLARNERNWRGMSARNKMFGLGTNVEPGFVGLYDEQWFEDLRRKAAPCLG